ncbi:putative glycolipid-binding domain-containing protein [Nocardia vermiculata]|uniref:Putative glycolipid-binding domain-containing protein n=1 Tax=Nocardia vermiculata TaxID=257274 RepID=A0A846XSF1_9NOCA|nr:putative glycolipid-binding domain-containing protein [Nocardia vermiculata]
MPPGVNRWCSPGEHLACRTGAALPIVAYGRGVSEPDRGNFRTAQASAGGVHTPSRWPTVLTFRAHDATRLESVRVGLSGNRIRASGRIVAGESADHPAFSASYDLVTDEVGRTKRLSLRSTVTAGERHASIARDEENYWLVDAGDTHVRSMFGGALDVDVALSPFFNTLPIRRFGLAHATEDLQVPVVYVRVPELVVQEAILTYSSGADGIHVLSPVASATVTVDDDGFVLDYPGLSERI